MSFLKAYISEKCFLFNCTREIARAIIDDLRTVMDTL